jgi:hypothetical protein
MRMRGIPRGRSSTSGSFADERGSARLRTSRVLLRVGLAIGVACAAALLIASASSARGVAPPLSLDIPPAACTVNYAPGSDCLVQTRLGNFSLSTHVVQPGETLTGTISPGCVIGYGNNSPCPNGWKGYGLPELGTIVSGCGVHDYSCTVRIPKDAPSSSAYDVVFIGITNAQGTGYSSDYVAVIGKDKAVIEGKISDKQSQGLAGVQVDAQGGGGHYAVQTSANGGYVIEVKAGSYRVTPKLAAPKPPGFTPASAERTVRAGETVHADFAADLPSLSVTDVSPGSSPLDVAVKVAFADAGTDASGCDPKAAYAFTDPAVVASTKVGVCRYQLTFAQPGTGIYRVALTATTPAGEQVKVSVDQFGNKVDGLIPVIIDSCKRPTQDVPDVSGLVNSQGTTCDVSAGSWDADAADIPPAVVTYVENLRGLEVVPAPVATIDPSDWSGRALVVVEAPHTGWLPTGDAGSNGQITGPGGAVGLFHEIYPADVPDEWNGDGGNLSAAQLKAVPPATVISAHGAWLTPNGLIRVPAGDTITMYVPIGTAMDNGLGLHVDTGHIVGKDKMYLHTYTAGQLIPDFTFVHYGGHEGEVQGAHVTGVTTPANLDTLVRPGEGAIWLASCANVYAPVGETEEQALANLPIYTPGAPGPTASATVDDNGVLHTVVTSASGG